MKTEEEIKDKLIDIYYEQEEYDSYDNSIKISILKWVLEDKKELKSEEKK